MDMATAFGRNLWEMEVGGDRFQVGPLEVRDWADTVAWIGANVKLPLARAFEQLNEVDRLGIPVRAADRTALLDAARKEGRVWPPPPKSEEWRRALTSDEGSIQFFLTILKKHNPDLTAARMACLMDAATEGQLSAITFVALGSRPEHPDPKGSNGSGQSSA